LIIDSSAYAQFESENLENIQFNDQSGHVIPSWLESGNTRSSTRTVYWLRLTRGIPANRAVTVYMVFGRTTQNMLNSTTTGEAPSLSPIYGQFDNGAQVFARYANFAGISLPPGWSGSLTPGSRGAVAINNEVNLWHEGTGGGVSFLGSDWVVGENVVEMHLLSEMTRNGQDMIMFCTPRRGREGWTPNSVGYQNGSSLEVENNPGGTPSVLAVANPSPALPAIIGFQGNTVFADYEPVITIDGPICGSTFLAASANTGYNASFSFDWIRMRPGPPANVMPTTILSGTNQTRTAPAGPPALTDGDIIKLVQLKLADPLIIEKIKSSACAFDTSADGLDRLKRAGVSDAVVLTMLEGVGQPLTAPPTQPTPPSETPVIKSVKFSFGVGQNLHIEVRGHGFGQAPRPMPFTGNLPYFSFNDLGNFEAGNVSLSNWDAVTLNYISWGPDRIVVAGFSGAYGAGSWKAAPGDHVVVTVWNPSSGLKTTWAGVLPFKIP
jgi:hypothetical protein